MPEYISGPLPTCARGLLETTPGAHSVGLMQAWPNPFNPTASIRFTLPHPIRTALLVYDLSGRRVRTLVDADLPAGEHTVAWDGRNESGQLVASGAYFCRLTVGAEHRENKLMFLK